MEQVQPIHGESTAILIERGRNHTPDGIFDVARLWMETPQGLRLKGFGIARTPENALIFALQNLTDILKKNLKTM